MKTFWQCLARRTILLLLKCKASIMTISEMLPSSTSQWGLKIILAWKKTSSGSPNKRITIDCKCLQLRKSQRLEASKSPSDKQITLATVEKTPHVSKMLSWLKKPWTMTWITTLNHHLISPRRFPEPHLLLTRPRVVWFSRTVTLLFCRFLKKKAWSSWKPSKWRKSMRAESLP